MHTATTTSICWEHTTIKWNPHAPIESRRLKWSHLNMKYGLEMKAYAGGYHPQFSVNNFISQYNIAISEGSMGNPANKYVLVSNIQ